MECWRTLTLNVQKNNTCGSAVLLELLHVCVCSLKCQRRCHLYMSVNKDLRLNYTSRCRPR